MRVLVVNAGSSSVKLRLLGDTDQLERSADLEVADDGIDAERVLATIAEWAQPDVVGHRVVHGGTEFTTPVTLDKGVRTSLGELTNLAPLHQAASLAAVDAVSDAMPGVPAVACFDTAFHATIGAEAATYALPMEWRDQWAIRRYGFHGLSHSYASRRAAELVDRPVDGLRVVSCHLGAGASVCAVRSGRSVDTTMGFTPLDGLVMATRSGSVDPGLVLWLVEQANVPAHEVSHALEHRSGLLALAGASDLRLIEQADARGDQRAQLALDVYVHSVVAGIAAMAAAIAGLDVVAFTGGVGQNSALVRERVARRLAHLGVEVEPTLNADNHADADISAPSASARVVVVEAREDLEIAAGARAAMT